MRKSGNILWGVALIAIGVGFAGDAFGIWNFTLFFPGWWTLFIIIPCLVSVINAGPNVGNLIGIGVGLFLLLGQLGFLPADLILKLIIPVALVIVGIRMIFRDFFNRRYSSIRNANPNGFAEYSSCFNSQTLNFAGMNFFGAALTAIFGSMNVHLQNAVIQQDIVIHTTAMFGSVTVFTPPNVKVHISSIPIFGGVSNKTFNSAEPNAPTVYINSTTLFGGVTIR